MVTAIFVLMLLYFGVQVIDTWENEGDAPYSPKTQVRFMFWNTIYLVLSIVGGVLVNVHS